MVVVGGACRAPARREPDGRAAPAGQSRGLKPPAPGPARAPAEACGASARPTSRMAAGWADSPELERASRLATGARVRHISPRSAARPERPRMTPCPRVLSESARERPGDRGGGAEGSGREEGGGRKGTWGRVGGTEGSGRREGEGGGGAEGEKEPGERAAGER